MYLPATPSGFFCKLDVRSSSQKSILNVSIIVLFPAFVSPKNAITRLSHTAPFFTSSILAFALFIDEVMDSA